MQRSLGGNDARPNLAAWRRNVWSMGDRLGPLSIAGLQFRYEGGAIAGAHLPPPR
jgi:hypothetical protein